MKYPGQIQSTIDLLEQVVSNDAPADVIASQFFRRRKYIGSRDRKIISEFTFQLIRNRDKLNWWAKRVGLKSLSPRAHVILGLKGIANKSETEVVSFFTGRKNQPDVLTNEERQALKTMVDDAHEHPEMPPHISLNVPLWIYQKYQDDFNGEHIDQLKALNQQAPLVLRVNPLVTTREKVLKQFELLGWKATPTQYSPYGIKLERGKPLSDTDIFKQGLVEVQDESSQIASLLCDAKPGMAVLDICAGAGGKSLAIAGMMANKGRLTLMDISAWRLSKARERLRRASISNYEVRLLDSEGKKWLKRQAGRFDRVVTDVPCSGSGTWRRNPDLKWRFQPNDLNELEEKQREILHSAAPLVKPGGYLIYTTCSLFKDEDEHQIERFLKEKTEFEVQPLKEIWQGKLNDEYPGTRDTLKLTPHLHQTDGFFIAVLKRKS